MTSADMRFGRHFIFFSVRCALEASGIDLVACFNDPMPGNFMISEDGSIMLIDYPVDFHRIGAQGVDCRRLIDRRSPLPGGDA